MGELPAMWSECYRSWLHYARTELEAHDWQSAFANYPFLELSDAPLRPLYKDLARARIALVGSAGLVPPGEVPFHDANPEGDTSFRWVTSTGPFLSWSIHHGHYDAAAARQDYNTVFPLDILRSLAEAGEIGALAPRQVSFMGYQPDAAAWLATSVPAIVEGLQDDGVDAVLMVPV
ncbi:MAG: glycine/sarcosine/betaine reductase selenoprotein B family protein [Clostridia bacterium]